MVTFKSEPERRIYVALSPARRRINTDGYCSSGSTDTARAATCADVRALLALRTSFAAAMWIRPAVSVTGAAPSPHVAKGKPSVLRRITAEILIRFNRAYGKVSRLVFEFIAQNEPLNR